MRIQRSRHATVQRTRAAAVLCCVGWLTCPRIAASRESAYVANIGSNDVSVIDTSTRTLVGTIQVDPQPDGIAVGRDGRRAYVTSFGADTVSVIDTATNTVTGTIPVGQGPVGIAVSPDGAFVYVANRGADSISVIDTAAGAVRATIASGIGPGSNGIALAPDGASAYITNSYSKQPGTVSVVDTASNAVADTVEVYRNPVRIAIAPNGATAYVANFRSWNISVVDTVTHSFTTGVRASGRTEGVVVHPNGAYAYITNLDGHLEVLQTADNTLTEPIAVGGQPYAVALTHRGGEAYVANFADGTVAVVDLDQEAVVSTVPVGYQPFAVAINCVGSGCADPPFTPKPTRTATSSPTPTATPTLNPNLAVVRVGSTSGAPGERVQVGVSLETGSTTVVGVEVDVGFSSPLTIASASDGGPACTVGPRLAKTLISVFEPPACTGSECDAVRAIVLSFTNTNPIRDHAVLFTCDVLIAASATPGSYVLSVSQADSSTPDGKDIETTGVDGTITVGALTAAAVSIPAGRGSLCSGGPNDGLACDGDAQCAGLPCVIAQGVCDGGDDDGLLCDCPGSVCDGQAACGADSSRGTCRGGSADGQCCDRDSTCAGGQPCTATQRVCSGGVGKGLPCVRDAQCPNSVCGSTGSFCQGGEFDHYACVDHRDCPLGACRFLGTDTPGRGTPGSSATPTPDPGLTQSTTSTTGGGTCAVVPPAAARPGRGWLLVLPVALLLLRARCVRPQRRPPLLRTARTPPLRR